MPPKKPAVNPRPTPRIKLKIIAEKPTISEILQPYKIVDRRAGDVAICYADVTYAKNRLNWEAKLGLEEMCEDIWRWQSKNPEGYY